MSRIFNLLGLIATKTLGQWIEHTRSYSGYEREAAIHALRSHRDGSAIPCLLVRVNDWVPAVRDIALLALGDLLADEFADSWIAALDSLVALQRARRANHEALLAAVAALLGKPQHLPAVLAAAAQGSPPVRRYAFELQCNQTLEIEAQAHLLATAASGEDLPIARRALALTKGRLPDGAWMHVALAACKSRFAEMRASGLRGLLAADAESSRQLARDLSFDRSGGVRGVALHAIRSWSEEALVLELARAQLNDATVSAIDRSAALQVLCKLSPDTGRSYCEEAALSVSATMRCVGYAHLLATASEDEKDQLILRVLADNSSRVQRVAVESVRRGALPPASDAVLSIALQHGTEGALNRAVSLFKYYSYWTRLIALLRGFDDSTLPAGRTAWLNALVHWEMDGMRNFVTPSATQVAEIEALWKRCSSHAPNSLSKQISFHLSTYGLHTEQNA